MALSELAYSLLLFMGTYPQPDESSSQPYGGCTSTAPLCAFNHGEMHTHVFAVGLCYRFPDQKFVGISILSANQNQLKQQRTKLKKKIKVKVTLLTPRTHAAGVKVQNHSFLTSH